MSPQNTLPFFILILYYGGFMLSHLKKILTPVNRYFDLGSIFAHSFMLVLARVVYFASMVVLILPFIDGASLIKSLRRKLHSEVLNFYLALPIVLFFGYSIQSAASDLGLINTGFMIICYLMAMAALLSWIAHIIHNRAAGDHKFFGYGCLLWVIQGLIMIPETLAISLSGEISLLVVNAYLLALIPFLGAMMKKALEDKQID